MATPRLMPRYSLANDLWIGRCPPALQDLESGTQKLLPLVRTCIQVTILHKSGLHASERQRGLIGNSIFLPQASPSQVQRVLPPSAETSFVLVDAEKKNIHRAPLLETSHARYAAAVKCLNELSPYYQDLQWSVLVMTAWLLLCWIAFLKRVQTALLRRGCYKVGQQTHRGKIWRRNCRRILHPLPMQWKKVQKMNEIPDDSVLFCVLLLSNEVFRTIAMLLCFVWFDFQVNSWAYFPSNGMLLFFRCSEFSLDSTYVFSPLAGFDIFSCHMLVSMKCLCLRNDFLCRSFGDRHRRGQRWR